MSIHPQWFPPRVIEDTWSPYIHYLIMVEQQGMNNILWQDENTVFEMLKIMEDDYL